MHKLACEKAKMGRSLKKSPSILKQDHQISKIVQSLMRELVSKAQHPLEEVSNAILKLEIVNAKEKMTRTRGSSLYKAYSAQSTAKIILEVEPGVTQELIAQKYGVSQSLISKWLKEKYNIITA